jgi:hypothetical protein
VVEPLGVVEPDVVVPVVEVVVVGVVWVVMVVTVTPGVEPEVVLVGDELEPLLLS